MVGSLGQKAKKTLQEFVPEMDAKIRERFEIEIEKNFGFNERQKKLNREILEHAKEYILRPTKRLRGSFVYYGWKLGRDTPLRTVLSRGWGEVGWNAAIGIELVHAALLMHDDVMDRDEIRRGGPTTHKYYEKRYGSDAHFGEAMAVGVGDIVLCLGFNLLASCENHKSTIKMLSGIVQTGYGQAFDMVLERERGWAEDDIIALHKAKTAIYTYDIPLFVGGSLAGLSGEALKILHDYAMDGGVAFQLQDDILGVYGDDVKTGKLGYRDIKEGKVTLLFVKSKNERLKELWGKKDITINEVREARRIIEKTGSLEYSRKLAREYAARAAKTAERLRKLELDREAIDYIQGIAEYMVEREV